MEESEQDSVIEDDSADTERQETRHPWPYLKELFVVVGYKKDSWRMQCNLCLPKKHELLAFKNSPSNLKKHIQLLRPNDTRWNSMYLAVERIIRIMREQGEGAITAVCTTLKLPMLSPAEIAFLSEYVKIMCPVAKAIDVLQGETNVQMGWLIPTITLLKTKLQHLRLSSKCCVPLIDALQSGLQKRFGEMLKDPELIAASILVPKFRRCWTTDEGLLQLGLDYIKSHLKELPVTVSDSTPSSEEDDFFSPIKQGNLQENTKQLESYLACPNDTMEILKSFPARMESREAGWPAKAEASGRSKEKESLVHVVLI
uniref:BED-type domain-containing protein n=1 Tax=Knipowitschia caucasica TaxID=637954 RepID=A0AAV2KIY4_KNICA